MRKFLWVVAVGALVLALAAPAMALDFKFGAAYRVRMYSHANVGFTDLAGTNPRGVQLRVRPQFSTSDDNGNITSMLRLEVGDVEFGEGGGASGETNSSAAGGTGISPGGARVGAAGGGSLGADGVNVETKWAYMDFAMPFGLPARVRAGIQPWYLPKGLIVDDDVAGLRIYGSMKPVSYEVAWYRASGGPSLSAAPAAGTQAQVTSSETLDNNYDFYQVKLDSAVAPWFNPGIYYVYGDNRVNCSTAAAAAAAPCVGQSRIRDNHWIGITTTGKIGTVSYDLDWVYGISDGGPAGTFVTGVGAPITVKGWVVDAAVHFPIGPATLNLAASYATGDRRDGGDSEAFPTIAAGWSGAGGGFEMIGGGGEFDVGPEFTQDSPANLWMIGGWINYNMTKALALKAAYGYAAFQRKLGNCAGAAAGTCAGPGYAALAGKSALGHEFSFRADYTVWTGFKVQGQVGWILPGGGGSTEPAGEYILQMLYNF
jgi:hypothetical protein